MTHRIRRGETLLVEITEVRVFARRKGDGSDPHAIEAVPVPPDWQGALFRELTPGARLKPVGSAAEMNVLITERAAPAMMPALPVSTRPRHTRSRGFTMIELIVVIVILGVLAAVALPRFTDLRSDAEKAVVEGLVGAVRSAQQLAFAGAVVAGIGYTSPQQMSLISVVRLRFSGGTSPTVALRGKATM